MNRLILAVVVFALMLVTSPLLGQSAPEPGIVKELPSVELPPDLDRVLRDYERAWRAGDAVALTSLFAEDGFVLQSNRPPIRGRAAIQAAYNGQAGSPLRLRALAFTSGDTIAFIIGGYDGDDHGDIGKFTLTLRRAPGEAWLIYSDMENMNSAPQRRRTPHTPSVPELPPAH